MNLLKKIYQYWLVNSKVKAHPTMVKTKYKWTTYVISQKVEKVILPQIQVLIIIKKSNSHEKKILNVIFHNFLLNMWRLTPKNLTNCVINTIENAFNF